MIGFGGVQIIEDPNMTRTVEDWSHVRSPSRAARRRKQGHRQNIRFVQEPMQSVYRIGNAMVMHPVIAAQLRQETTP